MSFLSGIVSAAWDDGIACESSRVFWFQYADSQPVRFISVDQFSDSGNTEESDRFEYVGVIGGYLVLDTAEIACAIRRTGKGEKEREREKERRRTLESVERCVSKIREVTASKLWVQE